MKRTVVVDIADMAISEEPGDLLVTYSLGSCLGVAVYDPGAGIGGMMHCMLPLAGLYGNKPVDKPCMFVDTGMVLLLGKLVEKGARKARMVVKAAGCAEVLPVKSPMFRIGERNFAVLRKILWKNSILLAGSDVGGSGSRTIRLDVETGRFTVKAGSRTYEV